MCRPHRVSTVTLTGSLTRSFTYDPLFDVRHLLHQTVSPLQGWVAGMTDSQGVALGWNSSPLWGAENRSGGRGGAETR